MKVDYNAHNIVYMKRKLTGYNGWDADEVIEESIKVNMRLLQLAKVPKKASLLDVGCGAGNLTFFFESKGFKVTGVDVSENAINWAKEKATACKSDALFSVMNLAEYATFSHCFDVVIDNHCLHCIIGEDRLTYLGNIQRCLQMNGYYILSSMCSNGSRLFLPKDYDPKSGCIISKGVANRYIGTPEAITMEIVEAGFCVDHVEVLTGDDSDELLLLARKR